MKTKSNLLFIVLCVFFSTIKSQNELRLETFGQKNSADSSLLMLKLSGPEESKIFYSLDGTEPTKKSKLYTNPFTISKSCTIKAIAFVKKKKVGNTLSKNLLVSHASSKKIMLPASSSAKYCRDSMILSNSIKELETEDYTKAVGWEGTDAVIAVDMFKLKFWSEFTISCAIDKSKLCYPPKYFEIFYSKDNQVFNAAIFGKPEITDTDGLRVYKFQTTSPIYGRFVKFVAYNYGQIKNENTGQLQNTLIVVDEIGVE